MKQVPIKQWKQTALECIQEPKIINLNGLEVAVKQYLPATEKLGIADFVANRSFVKSVNDVMTFNPILKEALMAYMITSYYTNLRVGEGFTEMADLLLGSYLYAQILVHIPEDEIDAIEAAIYEYQLARQEVESERRKKSVLDYIKQFNEEILPEMMETVKSFDPESLKALIPNSDLEKLK